MYYSVDRQVSAKETFNFVTCDLVRLVPLRVYVNRYCEILEACNARAEQVYCSSFKECLRKQWIGPVKGSKTIVAKYS